MVPQGYNYTVERFGRYIRTLHPGLGVIFPFVDRIGAKQNMMEQVLQAPSQEVITRDNAMVTVDGVAFPQIVDAARASYEVKRASILEVEGLRQAAILKAEGEKQATVLAAEGRREAALRDAEARERLAEDEAKATSVVSSAIAKGSIHAINYFVANNYVRALEKLASAPNQKVLMLPLEAASVIGAIGGIAEIARETFGPPGDAAAKRKV